MNFEIIEKSWYKRRIPDRIVKKIISVDVPDMKYEHNHMCIMNVKFNDGTEKDLISRVIFNNITKKWVVDGLDVSIRILEDVAGMAGN